MWEGEAVFRPTWLTICLKEKWKQAWQHWIRDISKLQSFLRLFSLGLPNHTSHAGSGLTLRLTCSQKEFLYYSGTNFFLFQVCSCFDLHSAITVSVFTYTTFTNRFGSHTQCLICDASRRWKAEPAPAYQERSELTSPGRQEKSEQWIIVHFINKHEAELPVT